MPRADELLAALRAPTEIAGVTGVGTGRTWDAVVSAHAPALTGEDVTFTALEDRTLVVDQDVPDDSLAPIAEALEQMVSPPYRAAATRTDAEVWTAVAESVRIVSLVGLDADEVDLTVVDGERTLSVGGEPTSDQVPALDDLAAEHDSVAVHAERVDGDLFAVDVFPL
jgi:hypothetical protein